MSPRPLREAQQFILILLIFGGLYCRYWGRANYWNTDKCTCTSKLGLYCSSTLNLLPFVGCAMNIFLFFLLEQTHLLTHDACALHRGRPFPLIMCFPPTPPRNRCTTPVPSRSWKVGMSQALTTSCFDDVVLCAFLYSWQMFCVDIMAPSLHMAKPPPGRLTPWRYRSVSFVVIFTILILLFWTSLLCWRQSPSYSQL